MIFHARHRGARARTNLGRIVVVAFALLTWFANTCKAETSDEAEIRGRAQRFFDDYNKRKLAGGMTL